ncbi:MAG: DUF2341 domain-containing protein [Bacteroidetes bacterium]|nr:DUF2341 domain-containing protein [Bacteroidota bacterium]
MKIIKIFLLFLIFSLSLYSFSSFSQSVAINTSGNYADNSSILDVDATNQGILIPRLTTISRNAIPSPSNGLLIYNTDTNLFNYYNDVDNKWYEIAATFVSYSSIGAIHPGGGVSINSTGISADSSAALDINDTKRGVLFPRNVPASIIAPVATGLIIYNTSTNRFAYYNGSIWIDLCVTSVVGVSGATGNQNSEGCAINTSGDSAHFSSRLDVASADKGVLIPRLFCSERNNIKAVTGLTIYNKDDNAIEYYSGSGWYKLEYEVPAITSQPANPTAVCAGTGTPSFTVTATGAGLTYQWQEYISSWNDISEGGFYTGTTSAVLTITNPTADMNGYKYRCIVNGTCAPAVISDGNAMLTVNICCCDWALTGNWLYKDPVNISNTGGALTDYQVLIVMNTQSLITAGKMSSDGSDIRITDTDKCTELYFWFEQNTFNTANTYIWVKVPSIASSSSKTIYIYYGKAGATGVSNGNNTFLVFDDFDAATMTISGNTAYKNFSALGNINFETVYMVEHKGGHTSPSWEYGYVLYGIKDNVNADSWVFSSYIGDDHLFDLHTFYGTPSFWQKGGSGFRLSDNAFYRKKLLHLADNNFRAAILNSSESSVIDMTQTDSRTFSPNQIYWEVRNDNSGWYITHDATNKLYKLKGVTGGWQTEDWIHFFFIKKYTSLEPTTAVGTEESACP